ncbi:DEAD/DEAH box helicase [Algibacillus agarilyticus]|uniref:DEAD/DEAH box helicase n=1 Tax=Algibacillus agarilyticus TaxID=2234133 RepID=UPI000DCFB558|nr:DEAD/DEAH box helicase [Algibacillus agarilyticus]
MSVDSIGLSAELLQAVKACGYQNLTPIQQKAIPLIRKGHDLLASAQTGTGKTAAYSLPLIDLINQNRGAENTVKALILTPTRELAQQVKANIESYIQFLPLTCGVVFGGGAMPSQTKMLQRGVDILVATPGRLLEHTNLRNVQLKTVKYLVLDEADRMLDMGFLSDIERLLPMLNPTLQTMMFSATFSNNVKTLANQILKNPISADVAKQNTTSGKVKQSVYLVSEDRKRELLSEIIGVNNWQQVLVFAGTKESANILAKELKLDGIKAAICHGDKSQGARNKALSDFVEGKVRVMVATDVAARGIDIPDLPYVVNFHLPFLAEDYVHRVGRTGRAGKNGTAISLVSPKDEKFLSNIEALIERKFERIVLPGYEIRESNSDHKKAEIVNKVAKNRYEANKLKNRAVEKKTKGKKKPQNSTAKYNKAIKKKR